MKEFLATESTEVTEKRKRIEIVIPAKAGIQKFI
jgi:hypothetical protein